MTIRMAKIVAVTVIAAFFSLVVYGNVVDFDSNFAAVRHVLSMDTTYQSPNLMWRAIDDPILQIQAYWLIIGWEGLTAFFCWLGALRLMISWAGGSENFNRAKSLAVFGLLMGFLLYGFGFLVVASEWFAMWQSKIWNAQETAGMFAAIILGVMIFVAMPEPRDADTGDATG
ncbi:MAG: DUF2165 domain-containing protein [Alphaproteobacteria bacterium]|nr:DUF2165 domain-containing protein [Alphaproteobacteria bacterium]